MGTLWLGGGAEGLICPKFYTDNRRGYRISWRGGGGVKTFHKHPTPLGPCLCDVIRPPEYWKTPPLLDIHKHPPWTLSAWRHPPSEKLKNTPTLGHSQAPPPPWTLPVWRHPHSKGGCGGDRSRSGTLCNRFSVSGQVQGGGGWSSLSPPPLDPPLDKKPQPKNRSRAPVVKLISAHWIAC